MRLVLDTNVIVSGFLSPYEAPGQIVQRVAAGEIRLLLDTRILAEYREVLLRPKFNFSPRAIETFLVQVEADGQTVLAKPLAIRLPDADDEAFLEVAIAGQAEALVTGNAKHYPAAACKGIRILNPAQFLNSLR